MPRTLAPTLAHTAPRLFHSPPNWPPTAYVTTPLLRRAAVSRPGTTAPAVDRPLARDASCSFTNAATTRLRVRGSGSEPAPGLTGPLCRQPQEIKRWYFQTQLRGLASSSWQGGWRLILGSNLKGEGTLCSPVLGKGRCHPLGVNRPQHGPGAVV